MHFVATASSSTANQGERFDAEGVPRHVIASLCQRGIASGMEHCFAGFEFIEELASHSGVLAFLWLQHLAGTRELARYLPADELRPYFEGERLCGIAMSPLNAPACPITVDGEQLNGRAPWYSGWGLFDDIVVGARDSARQPFLLRTSAQAEGVTASPPAELFAMESSKTVSLSFSDSRAQLLGPWNSAPDPAVHLRDCGLALGVCRAVRERIPAHYWQLFEDEYRTLRSRVESWPAEPLELRADCLYLALRATQTLWLAAGGAGNRKSEAPQRLLREASFFAVLAGMPDLLIERVNGRLVVA